jgi:hypothetical protein
MLRRTLIGLVAIGILGSFMGMGGFSLFTATTHNDANTFTSGIVDISSSPATAFLHLSNMAPGDSVTAKLTISNDGTLPMRYSMTTDTTDVGTPPPGPHLDDTLTLEIRELGTNCTLFNGALLYGGTGETLADGYIGNPNPGPDTGDRPLPPSPTPGASEDLCFKVTLPKYDAEPTPVPITGPMGAGTTATFTFDAEQTANNP